MPLRSNWSADSCPLARGLEVLGDPWSLLILREIFFGQTRFDEIRDSTGIADSVLSKRLTTLVEQGLLAKAPFRDASERTRHAYVLTPKGEGALPVLNAMIHFAEEHTDPPSDTAHMSIIHSVCGQATTSADRCDRCQEVLTPGNTTWISFARSGVPVQLATAGPR